MDELLDNCYAEELDEAAFSVYHDLAVLLAHIATDVDGMDDEPVAQLLAAGAALGNIECFVGIHNYREAQQSQFPFRPILDALITRGGTPGPRLGDALRAVIECMVRLDAQHVESICCYNNKLDNLLRSRMLLGEYDIHKAMAEHFAWFAAPGKLTATGDDGYPIFDNDPYRHEHEILNALRAEIDARKNPPRNLDVGEFTTGKEIFASDRTAQRRMTMAALTRVRWAAVEPRAREIEPKAQPAVCGYLLHTLLRRAQALEPGEAFTLVGILTRLGFGRPFEDTQKRVVKQLDHCEKNHGPCTELDEARDLLAKAPKFVNCSDFV